MMGGRILAKAGGAIFGRIVTRIRERRAGVPVGADPADSQPAAAKVWEMPPWLRLIVDLITAFGNWLKSR